MRNKKSEIAGEFNPTVPQVCRICGCSELDACYHPDFGNCWWVEPDLCSHCVEVPGEAVRYSKMEKEA